MNILLYTMAQRAGNTFGITLISFMVVDILSTLFLWESFDDWIPLTFTLYLCSILVVVGATVAAGSLSFITTVIALIVTLLSVAAFCGLVIGIYKSFVWLFADEATKSYRKRERLAKKTKKIITLPPPPVKQIDPRQEWLTTNAMWMKDFEEKLGVHHHKEEK